MRYVVLVGGKGIDHGRIAREIRMADFLLCADEGAAHARKMRLIPKLVVGDMDSIDSKTRQWVREKAIPTDVYPAEKDMTDSELCLSQVPKSDPILLVMPLCGRYDHVISNVLISARYAEEGREIVITDGRTRIYPIAAPTELVLDVDLEKGKIGAKNAVISVLPLFGPATGITSTGLHYPMEQLELHPGHSLGISNYPRQGEREVKISFDSGVLLVIISDEDQSHSP
ncbi:MAG: thiamine diphosphokinase [Clostridiales bacterium]|nr:thiamine diphosphokinase [Clostridiales bacterium]